MDVNPEDGIGIGRMCRSGILHNGILQNIEGRGIEVDESVCREECNLITRIHLR